LTEFRAKKIFADASRPSSSACIFSTEPALARYLPQSNAAYPKEFKEEGFWTTVYYNAYVAYNTRLAGPPVAKTMTICSIPSGKASYMEGTKAIGSPVCCRSSAKSAA
jgi:hypothetical protein